MSKISIILPVYNGGDYLEDAVDSIICQDFQDFEFLICDDTSTDDSYKKLLKYAEKYPEKIKLFRNEHNEGLFKNLNFLLHQCQGPLIKLWSQDDVMMPNCLTKIYAFHQTHSQISMSYHRVDYIDENNNLKNNKLEDGTPEIIDLDLYCKISIKWGCMPGNIANVTLVKEYLDKAGVFNENFKVSGDFELWTRLASTASIGRIAEPLIYLRQHQGQLSNQNSSIYYRLKEDLPIFQTLLSLIPENDLLFHQRIFKRIILVSFFNETVFLIRKGQFKLALRAQRELLKYGNFYSTFFYWLKWLAFRLQNKHLDYHQKLVS